jgi:hypothetical protein
MKICQFRLSGGKKNNNKNKKNCQLIYQNSKSYRT